MMALFGTLRVIVLLKWLGAKPRRKRVISVLVLAYVAYMVFKMLRRVLRPETVQLLFAQTERNRRLMAACPGLKQYSPTPWLWNGHLQTLFGATLRQRPGTVKYTRTFVDLTDGGHVALDWHDPFEPGKATVLVLHGLTGGSDECYVHWLVHTATSRGLQCVVFNARGCGGSGLSTPRSFSAAQTEDLRTVVREVRKHVGPSSPLFAVGYSLGAGVLVKYLGERGKRSGISAAAACCASYDMLLTSKRMETPLHKLIYNRQLTSNLRRWLKRHETVFRQASWLNLDAAYQSRTVREFDEAAIVKQFGYRDVVHYYEDASSARLLPNVAVPLLIANAKDDPIAHAGGVPLDIVDVNDKVFIALTKEGGHVAWCQGMWPVGASWDNAAVIQFFEGCMSDLEFIQEQPDEQPYAPIGATAAQKAAAAAASTPGYWTPMLGSDDEEGDFEDDGPLMF